MEKNAKNTESTTFITSLFEKFGNKIWFQIIIGFWLVVGPILFIASPFINNYMNKETAKNVVVTTLDQRDEHKSREHKKAFEHSKQAYAMVKKCMNESLSSIDAQYLFLIEYHNGAENIMTGIQFCRFDITIEASYGDLAYIPVDKFKDDIVARYDILLSEDLNNDKLLFYKKSEFEKVDKYLTYQLSTVDAKSFAIVNLKDKDGKVFGSLLCVSTDEYMDKSEILICSREIENIINNSLK